MSTDAANTYIDSSGAWAPILRALRTILLSTGLEETIKWGAPAYTLGGKNVVGMVRLASYVSLWFYQGALLSDPDGLLIAGSDGGARAQRQLRFTSEQEVAAREAALRGFLAQAKDQTANGQKIAAKKDKALILPPELAIILSGDAGLAACFAQLGLTKKREFVDYIDQAKRAETKQARIEKIIPMIRLGIGLNDRYR